MRRSENLAWAQVKIGVFIVVALVLAAIGILLMGQKTKYFIAKGKLSVIMTDVAGLKIGAPVWLAGIDVGIVKEIHFERPQHTNEVEIILEIERQALKKVGKDSRISVKTRGLMGEKYIDITPSQYVSEVPETRIYGTATPKLDDVMQKAGGAFDRLNEVVEKMNRGEGSLGRFTTDPKLYNNLVRLTAELSTFANNVTEGQGSLGKLYRNDDPYLRLMSILTRVDNTFKTIQSSDGTMSRLINDPALYQKMLEFADKSGRAADDIHDLKKTMVSGEGTVGKLLTDKELYEKGVALMERADRAVKPVEEMTSRLNKGEGTAGKLLSDRELYEKMNAMMDNLDLLIKDLKENPRRYLKFSVF